MSKTIYIHEDRVDILRDGIIEKTIYNEQLVELTKSLLKKLEDEYYEY